MPWQVLIDRFRDRSIAFLFLEDLQWVLA